MKIFQEIQRNVAFLGYARNARVFNGRQQCLLVGSVISLISVYVNLCYVASSPKEYLDSISLAILGSLLGISALDAMINVKTIFVYIDDAEEIISSSE